MEKHASNQKHKKKQSQPKPNVLKPKVIKWKKKSQIKKEKKLSQPKPDELEPNAIK